MRRNKNTRDSNLIAMREFNRYEFTNMDTGLACQHLKYWIEFSCKLDFDTRKMMRGKRNENLDSLGLFYLAAVQKIILSMDTTLGPFSC